ncbi:uncharacterized protein LOC62_03G005085 [Vanrija pseudolonga]|uniref:Uncharacterized protein n=1 Tax=Vanrija pseudolonga TaxID=143232 RepID=A0AAF0YDL5_9TREE|nr:hypothetical protein LOC62_03G005085 [Vanrija pseudolonga]
MSRILHANRTMQHKAPPILHKIEGRRTALTKPPSARDLYGGKYPRLVGVPDKEVAEFLDNDMRNDRYPVLWVDDNLYRSYKEDLFDRPRKLMDPVLGHLHLHPRFAWLLPFLKPLPRLAVDDKAQKYIDEHVHDWAAYLYEGQIPCDRCLSIAQNHQDEPCPCFFVNLGGVNKKQGVQAYKLNCYRCAQVNEACTFTVGQGQIVFRRIQLYARFVSNPTRDMSLEQMVWWPGMVKGPATEASPTVLDNPDERRRPAKWDAPSTAQPASGIEERRRKRPKRGAVTSDGGATHVLPSLSGATDLHSAHVQASVSDGDNGLDSGTIPQLHAEDQAKRGQRGSSDTASGGTQQKRKRESTPLEDVRNESAATRADNPKAAVNQVGSLLKLASDSK